MSTAHTLSSTLADFLRRYILCPIARWLGMARLASPHPFRRSSPQPDRWEPRTTARVHCIGCGHRFVLTLTRAQLSEQDDGGLIEDASCPGCQRDLLFWDQPNYDDE
jgi:hypothetical protein